MNSNSTPNYKALCAELVDDLEMSDWPYKLKEVFRADITRARDALAQPEPKAPTDEELLEVASKSLAVEWYVHIRVDSKELEANGEELIAYARAVLARWGTPANTINQEYYDHG